MRLREELGGLEALVIRFILLIGILLTITIAMGFYLINTILIESKKLIIRLWSYYNGR